MVSQMGNAARGHLAMLLFSALVAGSFSLGSLAANEIAPLALVFARFVLAAALIGALVAFRGGVPRAALAASWRYILLGGLFAIYFVLMFEGLKTAPPVSAAAVFTMVPIMSAVFGWILLRQVTSPLMAASLSIGALGALWVIFQADLAALVAFRIGTGEMIYFVGCAAHALYTPLIRKLNRGEDPLVFTLGTLMGGALVLAVVAGPAAVATDWAALPGIVWVTIAYTTVFATAVTFYLVQYATLHLPSSKVMAYTWLTPSWVILWEIGFGNAAPPVLVLGGVALTVVALLGLLKEN